MHISEFRIRHFRNFLCARFRFEKGVNTLVGENGSGKTNALYALRLLIDDSLSRNAGQLRDTDFCRAIGDWRGHWIVLSLDFDELDASEGCQLIRHEAGHMDGSQKGTCSLVFRPKRTVRSRLFAMCDAQRPKEEIGAYIKSLTLEDYETMMTGRGTGDFLDSATYKSVAGDPMDFTFPDPDKEDQGTLGVAIRHPIHAEVSCTFAQALRDVIADLRGSRFNPLLALLRGAESTIAIKDAEGITEAVAALNAQISSLPEVRRIADGVQSTLDDTVGHTYSPAVTVESALPDTIDRLVQRLTVKVGDDPNATYRGELTEQSLGGANLIYLALKLLEFEYKRSSERVAHFLLIEEPEAHIHTHIQKTLFERQSTRRTQVIVSTHSTHISSASRIRSVNVLVRANDHAEVYRPANGLGEQAITRAERYLDAVRSTLLFARGVVLVEGEAELVMVPTLVNAVLGMKPDELGVSVIAMDSAFFDHVAAVFHDDRIRRRCAIVTDSDAALITLPADPVEDSPEQRRARRAQLWSEGRKKRLEEFTQGNRWVRTFFADYTFEVDFSEAGNGDVVEAVVDSVYSTTKNREIARGEIASPDIGTTARRVLQMADHVGKGWFALLLAEKVTVDTEIPEYLLRAMAFAAGNPPASVFKRMILHRLTNNAVEPEVASALPVVADLLVMPANDVVARFQEEVPDDVVMDFLGFCREYGVE